jgi:hypothetical protein
MVATLVRAYASLVALLALVAAGHCDPGRFYPRGPVMAHLHLADAFKQGTPSLGMAGSFETGEPAPRTIHALSDAEEAFLAHGFTGTKSKDKLAEPGDYVASLQMAAAVGAAMQRIAALWDPRLTGVLIWLSVLRLLLRPAESRRAGQKTDPEE